MKLAHAAQNRPRSGVRKMMELAWGREDIVHLEVGEPGFATPPHAIEAADKAARDGWTHYSPTPGLPQLREALAEKVHRVNGITVDGDSQVLVTNGGANALFAIFGTLLDPGDSILVPNPGWSNFTMIASAFGAEPRSYTLSEANRYLPDVEEIRNLIDDRTRAIVVNSPSNPLGSVIPKALAQEIHELCIEKDIWLISDECYDQVDFSGDFVSLGSLEDKPSRILSVFSFSKVYAMTGWRVGYMVLPNVVAEATLGLLQPSVMCINTPAQFAAHAALTGPQDFLGDWIDKYARNRDIVLDRIQGTSHSALRPDGGFYVWMKVGNLEGRTTEDWAIDRLLNHGVAVTPGSAFGSNGEGYVRISLATEAESLALGIERLVS